jgi:hypothetical protein
MASLLRRALSATGWQAGTPGINTRRYRTARCSGSVVMITIIYVVSLVFPAVLMKWLLINLLQTLFLQALLMDQTRDGMGCLGVLSFVFPSTTRVALETPQRDGSLIVVNCTSFASAISQVGAPYICTMIPSWPFPCPGYLTRVFRCRLEVQQSIQSIRNRESDIVEQLPGAIFFHFKYLSLSIFFLSQGPPAPKAQGLVAISTPNPTLNPRKSKLPSIIHA